jgi:putative ABC transport system permease protein
MTKTKTQSEAPVKRQITLPLSEALKISFRNIRIRLGRSLITSGGVFLGTAFLSSVLTNMVVGGGFTVKAQQIWVLVMSLLVAGLGVVNAMLMAVLERYREIGTMKCLGALDRFIVEIFLLESCIMGFFGSLLGTIVGMVVMCISIWIQSKTLPLPVLPLLKNMLFAIFVGTILSVICAIYPAYRAAKMSPAMALRTEI